MPTKKTWAQKLRTANGLPKIVDVPARSAPSLGKGTMVVPAPMEIDELMRAVKKGALVTTSEIRSVLATRHRANTCCPLVTGIAACIAAHAAEEAKAEGATKTTPWWRTLKSDGELNPKYPGGLEAQRQLLASEGHEIVARGKRLFVKTLMPKPSTRGSKPKIKAEAGPARRIRPKAR